MKEYTIVLMCDGEHGGEPCPVSLEYRGELKQCEDSIATGAYSDGWAYIRRKRMMHYCPDCAKQIGPEKPT